MIDFFDQYAEDQEPPKTKARNFTAWVYELNNHRKVRRNRELIYENYEIRVLDTQDGMASKVELTVKSSNDEDELELD